MRFYQWYIRKKLNNLTKNPNQQNHFLAASKGRQTTGQNKTQRQILNGAG